MTWSYAPPNDAYRLTLPDSWEYTSQSASVAFYDPNGVGALNVSSMIASLGQHADAAKVLLNFVSKAALEKGLVRVVQRSPMQEAVAIAHAEYEVEGNHWRVWVFVNRAVAVIASYNCDRKFRSREATTVDSIISSLHVA